MNLPLKPDRNRVRYEVRNQLVPDTSMTKGGNPAFQAIDKTLLLWVLVMLHACYCLSQSGQEENTEVTSWLTVHLMEKSSEKPSFQNPDDVRVHITSRKELSTQQSYPDLTLVPDDTGSIRIPVAINGKNIGFNFRLESEDFFLPELVCLTRNLPGEMVINPIRLTQVSAVGKFEITEESILPNRRDITGTVHLLSDKEYHPFKAASLIVDRVEANESSELDLKIPASTDIPAFIQFSSAGFELEYFFLNHYKSSPRYLRSHGKKADADPWLISFRQSGRITGRFTDHSGRPLAGMTLAAEPQSTDFRNISNLVPLQNITTDENGRFTLYLQFPGPHQLMATRDITYSASRKYSPEEDGIDLRWDMSLPEPTTLRGLLIDHEQKPVQNAMIQLVLMNGEKPPYYWNTRSDRDGKILWNSAPGDSVLRFRINRPGIVDNVYTDVDTSQEKDRDFTIQLKQPFSFSFNVVDKVSLQPVENAAIIRGLSYNPFRSDVDRWDSNFSAKFRDGAFHYESNQVYPENQKLKFSINAPGFHPVETEFMDGSGHVVKRIALSRWDGFEGKVVDIDGNPVPGCTVFATGIGYHVIAKNGNVVLSGNPGPPASITDEQGYFSMDTVLENFNLVAICRLGFAEIPVTSSAVPPLTLRLKPLLSLSGSLMKDRISPWQNQRIGIKPLHDNHLHNIRINALNFETITDGEGHFSLQGLPPLDYKVFRIVDLINQPHSQGIHKLLNIDEGNSEELSLGGTGITCTALIDLSALEDAESAGNYSVTGNLIEETPRPPEKVLKNPTLLRLWNNSQKVKERQLNQQFRIADVQNERTLVFYNVEAGSYRLTAQVFSRPGQNQRGEGRLMAVFEKDITISDQQAASDGIVELGEIPESTRISPSPSGSIRLMLR